MTKEYHQRDHVTRTGRLLYTSKKPDRMDEERGRERWTMTRHQDGRRSIMSHGEIDDRPSVLRFVHVTANADWSPVDAFVRITVGDEFRGSGWLQQHENLHSGRSPLSRQNGCPHRDERVNRRFGNP